MEADGRNAIATYLVWIRPEFLSQEDIGSGAEKNDKAVGSAEALFFAGTPVGAVLDP